MKIILLGYGKMGKEIEKIAISRHHEVVQRIDETNTYLLKEIIPGAADVAIEFTQPDAAFENIKVCLERNLPVVSGTTGWLERKKEVEALVNKHKGTFFYASNFSVGVNLFFHFNKFIAKMMNGFSEYDVEMEEIHHIYKKDAPSGTAITTAEGILQHLDRKKNWALNETKSKNELRIIDRRIAAVPGTHTVTYHSPVDSIELRHTAYSREGFATGAVLAAEFVQGKKGIFGMNDMLGF
ncbi:MAG TPA: 4-hydroxy-tetrahydrodipicolinate reductase [Cytophagales bacterium]|nr:4-hydroxy-tetrahydrodipicolinate reductase [Cytophagales bacterium]